MARNTEDTITPQPSNSRPTSPPHSHRRSSSGSNVRLRPRSDPLLIVCRCFSLITALSAILCIFVNVLSAVRSFKNGLDVFDGIFRCYAVAIAIFVVVAETEWSLIFRFWKLIDLVLAASLCIIVEFNSRLHLL